MKRSILHIYLILILCITARAGEKFKPEFYAFFYGMPEMSYDDEARMLKELGYNGISQIYGGGDQLVQRVAAIKSEKADDRESVIEKSARHLFSVSSCGADLDGSDWNTLIRTLDKGIFPQKNLLASLKKLNFKGPVGLQCFALKGD